MAGFRLDRALVDTLVEGGTDPRAEVVLAEQVARLLPFHASLPNDVTAELARLVRHFGGEQPLLAWLEAHPGRPRLVARLYTVIGLLDRFSGHPAVVTALRELRSHTPYPPGLEAHLVPDTDDQTLAGLSWEIEALLGDDRVQDAVRLAVAATELLERLAPRAAEIDPTVGDIGEAAEQACSDILAAAPHESAARE
jgi:hypothetical protein